TTATYEAEYRLRTKDGSWRWIQDRGRVTERAPDGAPIRAIGIHRDVTLRKQWETATREAELEARRMNRLKTAFLANINHELRTPLTAILGFSEVLMTHDDPTTQEYATMMHRSSQRLLRTFETIFDLTQIEDEDVRLHPQEVNATALARRVLSTFANEAEERGLTLSLEPSSPDATFTTDAYMVRRALTHLISNAIKFTDAGSVTLHVHGDDATVTYEVQDTGRGIRPDYLSRLFDAFTQESEGHARNYEGCGLGLHITSRLVDLLGGTLSVDSTPDAGTTVRIRLPRQPEPTSDAPA
ncbi:MAG: PAS domain-containing protein, partial [Bacteroidetes bacterium]|nr:PAS domain-containing protein [Bacteroidota bacterium]